MITRLSKLSLLFAVVALLRLDGSVSVAAIEPHGGMMRYPDVSATQITFVYADDI